MISSRYRFLYLHVSKTGGNAIQTALLPFSDDRQTLAPHQDGTERFGIRGPVTPHKHATLQEYETLSPGLSQSHAIVISVRHPFERAISAYFSPHRWLQRAADGSISPRPAVWSESGFLAMLPKEVRPMVDYLRLGGGLRAADIVIRHETLAQDFAAAVRALALPGAAEMRLAHVNRSAAEGALRRRLLADSQLRDRVEAQYRADMDAFGYASYRPAA